METRERVGEDLISVTDGQDSCRGGRRDTSNLEKTGSDGYGRGTVGKAEEPGLRLREEKPEKETERVWRGCLLPHVLTQGRVPWRRNQKWQREE